MKRSLPFVVCAALFAVPAIPQPAQVDLKQTALARLPLATAIASDPVVLAALRDKNASGETLEVVQARDREWIQNPQAPLRKSLTASPCAERLRELAKADPAVVEVILMDQQGANVCVSRETSDYWQGDEAKFKRTFGASQAVFVDEPAFDRSSGVYAIQVSVLVSDGPVQAGAMTLSLRVSRQDVRPR